MKGKIFGFIFAAIVIILLVFFTYQLIKTKRTNDNLNYSLNIEQTEWTLGNEDIVNYRMVDIIGSEQKVILINNDSLNYYLTVTNISDNDVSFVLTGDDTKTDLIIKKENGEILDYKFSLLKGEYIIISTNSDGAGYDWLLKLK